MGALIGVVVAFFDKPTYKAVLTFTMEEDKGGGGLSGALGLASSLGIDLGGNAGGAFSATNIIELMKSRLIVEKVLLNQVELGNRQRISFAEYYIQINKLREKWKDKPNIKDIRFPINGDRKNFSLQQDSILKQLYKLVTDKKVYQLHKKIKKLQLSQWK